MKECPGWTCWFYCAIYLVGAIAQHFVNDSSIAELLLLFNKYHYCPYRIEQDTTRVVTTAGVTCVIVW
jgi:hypothetical protein